MSSLRVLNMISKWSDFCDLLQASHHSLRLSCLWYTRKEPGPREQVPRSGSGRRGRSHSRSLSEASSEFDTISVLTARTSVLITFVLSSALCGKSYVVSSANSGITRKAPIFIASESATPAGHSMVCCHFVG